MASAGEAGTETKHTPHLAEFFAVIGRSGSLARGTTLAHVRASTRPREVAFAPCVLSQFPPEGAEKSKRDDMQPRSICQFAFPRGLRLSATQNPIQHFTSVLTDSEGVRFYVSCLILSEPLSTVERACLFLGAVAESKEEDRSAPCPSWLSNEGIGDVSGADAVPSAVYCPRALCIVSRYAFLPQMQSFLQQLVRICKSSAPVPVERYIANFCRETPVPPRGLVTVSVTVADLCLKFRRPPPNHLPLCDTANFARLFRCLSVENVVLLWSLALVETKIALCSASLSTLTPVSLALISLLFPFTWTGILIPVLPDNLLDLLDAPVPFMVGIDASYLTRVPKAERPRIVFVDLDSNQIHLGTDDETGMPREAPVLPSRDYHKLMKHLKLKKYFEEDMESSISSPIPDIQNGTHSATPGKYTDNVFGEEGPAEVVNFAIEAGVLSLRTPKHKGRVGRARTVASGSTRESPLPNNTRHSAGHLSSHSAGHAAAFRSPPLSVSVNGESEDLHFPAGYVRAGFLRFQTSVLRAYRSYIIPKSIEKGMSTTEMFDKNHFVESFPEASQPTMDRLIRSQAWSAFLQERTTAPWEEGTSSVASDSVRYFDEQIIAKMNRSMLSRKKATPFLDDNRWEICDKFTAPLPSMQRLPETQDGRFECEGGQFPVRFRGDLWFGTLRTPRQLTSVERSPVTSGEIRRALLRIHTQAHMNIGRRVSTSDFIGDEMEEEDCMMIVDLVSTAGASTRRSSRFQSSDTVEDLIQDVPTANLLEINNKRQASDYANTQRLVVRVQARWRSYLAQKWVHERLRQYRAHRESNAAKIQRTWRLRQQFKRRVCLLQSIARSRIVRQQYMKLQQATLRVQTWTRGLQCYHRQIHKRRRIIVELRSQIVKGWDATAVSLLRRSRFWLGTDVERPTYLDVGVHIDEVHWIEERKELYGIESRVQLDRLVQESKHIDENFFVGYQNLRQHSQHEEDVLTNTLMTHEDSLSSALMNLAEERSDIYSRLKGTRGHNGLSVEELKNHFESFGISERKRRKRKLSKMIWNMDENVWSKSSAFVSRNSDNFDETARCTSSARIVFSCLEPTDIDWPARWRQHRTRQNILFSLRGTLEALHKARLRRAVAHK